MMMPRTTDHYIIFIIIILFTIAIPLFTPTFYYDGDMFNCYSPQIYVDHENTVHTSWTSSHESDYIAQKSSLKYTQKPINSTKWSDCKTLYTPTAYNYQDAEFTVDKEENLHLVWGENIKDARVYYRYWNASKKKWNPIEIISDFEEPMSYEPRILVDDNFNVHLVWFEQSNYSGEGYDNLLYRCRNATHGTWQPIEILTFENSSSITKTRPSITSDNDNNIAIAWIEEGRVRYKLRYNNGTISNSTIISGSNCQDVTIACDVANNLHFTWINSDGYTKIQYAKYDRDTGQIFYEKIYENPKASNLSMVLDKYGNIHIVWELLLYDDIDIYYCIKTNSSLTINRVSREEKLGYFGVSISISVGTNNIIHFLWCAYPEYNGVDVFQREVFYKYKNLTSGEWSSTIELSLRNNLSLEERVIYTLLGFSSVILIEVVGFIIIRKRINRKLKKKNY